MKNDLSVPDSVVLLRGSVSNVCLDFLCQVCSAVVPGGSVSNLATGLPVFSLSIYLSLLFDPIFELNMTQALQLATPPLLAIPRPPPPASAEGAQSPSPASPLRPVAKGETEGVPRCHKPRMRRKAEAFELSVNIWDCGASHWTYIERHLNAC